MLPCLSVIYMNTWPVCFSHSWYGDYTMEVLLSASMGASSEDMGEHGALVTAVANAFVGKQTGNALNSMAIRILHCKSVNKLFEYTLPQGVCYGKILLN